MIPKVIHYCWFGRNPLPELALKCIDSWKRFFPEYTIIQWNEDNFDVNIIPYTREAYHAKKYAFVSDYARFWILNKYGGLYFDTDVEVVKSFDKIVDAGPFLGFEQPTEYGKSILKLEKIFTADGFGVNPGLGLGGTAGLPFFKSILDKYSQLHFINKDGSYNQTTIVKYTTDLLVLQGLQLDNSRQVIAGMQVYPWDYFCPQSCYTKQVHLSDNTVSIHLYAASWYSKGQKIAMYISKFIGKKMLHKIATLLKRLNIIK